MPSIQEIRKSIKSKYRYGILNGLLWSALVMPNILGYAKKNIEYNQQMRSLLIEASEQMEIARNGLQSLEKGDENAEQTLEKFCKKSWIFMESSRRGLHIDTQNMPAWLKEMYETTKKEYSEVEEQARNAVNYTFIPLRPLDKTDLTSESRTQKRENNKRSAEYQAEQYSVFIINSLKDWMKEGVEKVIYADRGAHPIGIVYDQLIKNLNQTSSKECKFPEPEFFKFTKMEKIESASNSVGEIFSENEIFEIAKQAYTLRYGKADPNAIIRIVDDWINTGGTRDFAVKLMQKIGYNFSEKDYEVLVSGPNEEKGQINPRLLEGSLPIDWRDIVDWHRSPLGQLQTGAEYSIDRVLAGLTYDDSNSPIKKNDFFRQTDPASGPSNKINVNPDFLEKDIDSVTEGLYDLLVKEYNIIDQTSLFPVNLSASEKNNLLRMIENRSDVRKYISEISGRNQYDPEIEDVLDDIQSSVNYFEDDSHLLKSQIRSIAEIYNHSKDIDDLNYSLGNLVIDWYEKRLRRGVDHLVERIGKEKIMEYVSKTEYENPDIQDYSRFLRAA